MKCSDFLRGLNQDFDLSVIKIFDSVRSLFNQIYLMDCTDKVSDQVHDSCLDCQQSGKDIKGSSGMFQFGNYNRYYGYRNQSMSPDTRLECFKREWFENKQVLDIGCNVGHVTLSIGRDYSPHRIVGIDIDENLIKIAVKNIRHYLPTTSLNSRKRKTLDVSTISTSKGTEGESHKRLSGQSSSVAENDSSKKKKETLMVPQSIRSSPNLSHRLFNTHNLHCHQGLCQKDEQMSENSLDLLNEHPNDDKSVELIYLVHSSKNSLQHFKSSDEEKKQSVGEPVQTRPEKSVNRVNLSRKPLTFPKNTTFRAENYVLLDDSFLLNEKPRYDTILCLSVTKWIHLNYGDDGLKRAFKRMYSQLKPEGILIIEPQPWSSYKKKKFVNQTLMQNYKSITFRPSQFNDYLLSEVGFSSFNLIDIPDHVSKGEDL